MYISADPFRGHPSVRGYLPPLDLPQRVKKVTFFLGGEGNFCYRLFGKHRFFDDPIEDSPLSAVGYSQVEVQDSLKLSPDIKFSSGSYSRQSETIPKPSKTTPAVLQSSAQGPSR